MRGKQLDQAVDAYIYGYSAELGLRPKTVKNKEYHLKYFKNFLGDRPLNIDTAREFVISLSKRGLKPNSICDQIRIIKAFVNFLFQRKYISENWSSLLKLPKVPKQELTLIDPFILEKVIIAGTSRGYKASCQEAREALQLMLRSGLRVAELIDLQGRDLRLDDDIPSFIVHSKGGGVDTLPAPKDMIPMLRKRAGNGRLFKVRRETLNRKLHEGGKALGIREHLHCHLLRHAFAMSLLRAGVAIQIVQRLLRHKDIQVTNEVYSHWVLQDLSLALNTQPIVREGLSFEEISDSLENTIRKQIKSDNRLILQIQKAKGEFLVKLIKK